MSDNINIRQVISSSTSDVALSELAKKGFKKVKVLNKEMVHQLVERAVDRVVKDRLHDLSEDEKQKYYHEAKQEFQKLARQRDVEEEGTHKKFEQRLASLEQQTQSLRGDLQDRNEQIHLLEARAVGLQDSLNQRETRLRELEGESIRIQEQRSSEDGALQEQLSQQQGQAESLLAATKLEAQQALAAQQQQAEQALADQSQESQQEQALFAQRITELEEQNKQLEQAPQQQPQDLALVVKNALLEMQQNNTGNSDDLDGLKNSIHALSQQIQKGGGSGAPASGPYVESSEVIESLFETVGDDIDMESNLDATTAKQDKAGGVSDSLNKLKSLKKGGGGK